MLDPRRLRADAPAIAAQLARRGFVFDVERFHRLEAQRKQLQTETEALQAERNSGSKRIGQAKARGEDVSPILADMERIKTQLASNEAALTALQTEFEDFASGLPNVPHASVPDGKSEDDNVEIRRWGSPRSSEGAKDHADLGEALGLMDFAAAAKLTGARFTVLRGGLSRLHRALTQFMLDVHTQEHGYEELYVPYIVNAASFRGTGQLPKFGDDLFWLWKVPGEGAQRIKEAARQAGVPIVERRALARALFRSVQIGAEIPPALYRAVAEILAYVYSLRPRSVEVSR